MFCNYRHLSTHLPPGFPEDRFNVFFFTLSSNASKNVMNNSYGIFKPKEKNKPIILVYWSPSTKW